LSKLRDAEASHDRVGEAVGLSLTCEAFDAAFELIAVFDRVDMVDAFLSSAFMPLSRSGRIATLRKVRDFATLHSITFIPPIRLIDAEFGLRDGQLELALAVAMAAAECLPIEHALRTHAHWLIGQAAQLLARYDIAKVHFGMARSGARDTDQRRDALWGLVVTALISEASSMDDIASDLEQHRMRSASDLVLATTAQLMSRRYKGFAPRIDVQSALHAYEAVPSPRIRTSFMFTLSYEYLVRSRYDEAQHLAELTRKDAADFQLSWIVPQAESVIAAAALARRDFAQADRLLRRIASQAGFERAEHEIAALLVVADGNGIA
jgi:hypothetical protein